MRGDVRAGTPGPHSLGTPWEMTQMGQNLFPFRMHCQAPPAVIIVVTVSNIEARFSLEPGLSSPIPHS